MGPDGKEVYTITIVKNYGRPFSFTIRKQKIALLTVLASVVAGLVFYASLDYLVLRSQNKKMSRQLEKTSERLTELNKQILSIDSKFFADGTSGGKELLKGSLLNQNGLSTKDLWAEGNSPTLAVSEGLAAEVESLTASITGDQLKVEIRIINQSTPAQVLGGFVSVTLVNEDKDPVVYKALTGGTLGEKGFPASFKAGAALYIKTKGGWRTLKQSLPLKDDHEYYTHAMVFIYSYKGTLLTRSTHRLDKATFLE